TTTVNTARGNDTVNVRKVSGQTTLSLGDGADTVNVGTLAPVRGGGTVDQILALLTVSGDAGTDTLNVDNSASTANQVGILTDSTLTGLGMLSVNEVQTITVPRSAGSYMLTFLGINTSLLSFDASAAAVQAALEALPGIGHGNVAVSRVDHVYIVTFQGDLTGINVPSLTPSTPSVTLATRTQGAATPARDDVQTVTVTATGGTFRLTLGGHTTAPIAFDASAHDVERALQIVLGDPFKSDVAVAKFGNTFVITLHGALRTVKNGLRVGFFSADTTPPARTIGGATRMGGIHYCGIETLNIDQGAGSDVLNVQSTSAVTNLNTGAGNDRVYVSSDANLDWTTNVGFDFLTGNLDGIRGTLNLDAGTDRQLLMISDE